MPPKFSKRMNAITIDCLIICLTVWGVFYFRKTAFQNLIQAIAPLTLGQPILVSTKFICAVFLISPIPLFLSFAFASASPGQYLMNIGERSYITHDLLNVFKSAIHSLLFVPSLFLLSGFPYLFALLDPERRTLIQVLTGTHSRSLKKGVRVQKFPKPVAIILIFLSLYSVGSLVWSVARNMSVSDHGLIIGGTAQSRADYFNEKKQESLHLGNVTPYIAFEAARKALKNRNYKELLQQLDAKSQLIVKAIPSDIVLFDELPNDVHWVRTEGDERTGSIKVYYREGAENSPSKEQSNPLVLVKEGKDWKLDITSLFQLKK